MARDDLRPSTVSAPIRRRRPSSAAALGITAALALTGIAGCANATEGSPAVAGWTSSPVYPVLQSIPASADSKVEISLSDPQQLNLVDARSEDPLPSTAPSGQLTPSDTAWYRYALIRPACYLDQRYQVSFSSTDPYAFPAAPPAGVITVQFGVKPSLKSAASVCVGPRRPIPNARATGSDLTPTTIAGVSGLQDEQVWTGFRTDNQYRFAIGTEVPPSTATSIVSGSAVAGSLAADSQVDAVLGVLATAPTIMMGTELLRSSSLAGKALRLALQAAETASGKTLPVAVFAGFGWTPGAGFEGTASFVTLYSSAAQAADAVTVLQRIWSDPAAAKLFTGAASHASGATVVTTVPDVPASRFNFYNLNIIAYPGYIVAR